MPGRSPAFRQRLSRYSSASQPCSTGTCGRKSPLAPMKSMISPSRPITMDPRMSSGPSAGMTSGGDRTVTSTVTDASSPSLRSGNLGSWQADLAAAAMASPSGMTGMGMPMHPLRSPSGCLSRVTNAPACSRKRGSPGIRGGAVPRTSDSTADLARATASSPNPIVAHRSS